MDEVHFLILILVLSVAFIILMTAKVKMHAFFMLILAALGVGLFAGLAPDRIISTIKGGFGNTLGAIGIVIVAGTCLGVVLEKTGAAISMADHNAKQAREHAMAALSALGRREKEGASSAALAGRAHYAAAVAFNAAGLGTSARSEARRAEEYLGDTPAIRTLLKSLSVP